MSQTSQDMIKGGFNPKIGIKGFIAMMMNTQKQGALNSQSSRGALRKTTRPLTHFGSEDAVSEKSEKDEESLSEDGESDGSSAQDLSDDDQNKVLNQVLDELMPNREVKKVEPFSAQIVVTKAKIDLQTIIRPVRKNLKSANRVIAIDKKLV